MHQFGLGLYRLWVAIGVGAVRLGAVLDSTIDIYGVSDRWSETDIYIVQGGCYYNAYHQECFSRVPSNDLKVAYTEDATTQ